MSSPSSARVHASSSRIRSSKRDVNPSASRSRVFGASAVSNSSRQVAGTGGVRSAARVYLDGVDVTPQSLLVSRIKPSSSQEQRAGKGGAKGGKPGARGTRHGGGGNSVMGASVILSQDHFSTSSIDDSDSDAPPTPAAASNQKTANVAPVTKATSGKTPSAGAPVVVGAAAPVGTAALTAAVPEDDDAAVVGDADPVADVVAPKMLVDIGGASVSSTLSSTTQNVAKPEKKARFPLTIAMVETPTEMLFELRSLCVAQDASYHQAVAARNRQYLETCAAKKGSDKFVEGRSQTLQLAQKTKEVMTAPPATRDSACTATDWDIFDCTRVEDENANDHDDNNAIDAAAAASGSSHHDKTNKSANGEPGEIGEVVLKQQVHEIVDATLASPGCVLDVDGDIVDDLRARQHALRHSRKHRAGHGAGSSTNNSQKSRVFHNSSGANTHTSQDFGRSSANVGNSSSSMASPSQSSGNVSFGASQDVAGLGGGEDSSSSSNGVANSQIGLSGGASRVLSNGDADGKQSQNAYARANTNVDMGEIIAQQRTGKVLASSSLLKTVSVVERAVQQNVYHYQHVQYRNFPALAPASTASSPALDPMRKDKYTADHDWRSSIGLASESSSNAASSVVPPIGSFNSAAGAGPSTAPGRTTGKAALEKLWSFQCSLTQGRKVTCLAWNTVNEDLLAVAYAKAEERPECPSPVASGGSNVTTTNGPTAEPTSSSDDGLILFWSLKNPEFPERIYNLDIGVTSIDFSHSHPYMLAAGFANGVIAIYDTRKEDAQNPPHQSQLLLKASSTVSGNQSRPPSAASGVGGDAGPSNVPRRHVPIPVATSETSNGKHLDTVWQVKWISKGSDRGENVVSISSDGRVTEWSMKKGLSFSDLMTLKRVPNPLLGSDARADGGVISRQASGHCIDFATHDPSVYYVGTEDGVIHKCSVSYNEQYLQTYFGHTGPVYQILVSPFSSELFLSCSADWNVKLWHQGDQKEAFNFRSVNLQHAVLGISWCPSDATIFGTVTEDGRIEIWDLQQSSLDPIITHYPKKMGPAPVIRGSLRSAPGTSNGGSTDVFDSLDNLTPPQKDATSAPESMAPCAIPLECTKIAFAPSAPVIVVGDSSGDVTVYRVPTLTERNHMAEPQSVEDQIAKLHRALNPNNQVALTRKDLTGDDFLQAFQEIDRRGKGYVASKSDVIDVVCDAIGPKYQRRLDFELIFKSFRVKHDRFDYIVFCEAFEKCRRSQQQPARVSSPAKSSQSACESRATSPPKSPQRRSNWLMEQQHGRTDALSDFDATNQKIRVDPRLETQRLLTQSIRRKLLHGVIGAQYDGFKGIEELLFGLDGSGDGYLDNDVFEREVLRRLKKPLTKQEVHFLLANLHVHTGDEGKVRPVVHYEHLASLCNLDSDASADETELDGLGGSQRPPSPTKAASHMGTHDQEQSLGGAVFLAAEKRLRLFFQQIVAITKGHVDHTPRSALTGAELFLERAEAIDAGKTGYLPEQAFSGILSNLNLDITPSLVRSMLERFPRTSDHKISYWTFLERYGENPQLARERRKLKRLLFTVLADVKPRLLDDWIQFLAARFEKYDARLHQRPRGDVPTKEFVHVLRGSSGPVALQVDVAAEILSQFLRVSRSSSSASIAYHDFLRVVRDCRSQASTHSHPQPHIPSSHAPREPATPPFAITNVADYLIHDATADERLHFEQLMELLHKFQQQLAKKAAAPTATSGVHSAAGSAPDATKSRQHGESTEANRVVDLDADEEGTVEHQAGAISPIENGIVLALGEKLQVRIQFTTMDENHGNRT